MQKHAGHPHSDETAILMDLLSHDVLNSNQAVLSYMDLILSSPEVDPKVRDYAAKATTQIRASSRLIEDIKRFMRMSKGRPEDMPGVEVKEVLAKTADKTAHLFQSKRLEVSTSDVDPSAEVRGGESVEDLFDNLFMNIVRLDPSEHVVVEVRTEPIESGDSSSWRIEVVSPNARLPTGIDEDFTPASCASDVSKVARVSGLFFASNIARALGGQFSAKAADESKGSGCVCEIVLRRAGPL